MISIVVPVYKVEKYLNRCVDSILNQTYTDFECILVDDGSPDKCGQICDEYAELDKRIRVIHKENGGLSDARNVGIDAAKGEYILFVDSDDWIHPQLIELTLKIIIKEKADVVSYDYKKVNNAGNLPFYDVDEEIGKVTTYSREYIIENLYNEYMQEIGVEACKKLYKKNIFDDLRFKKGIIHEDDDVFMDILFKIKTISIVKLPLYYYFMSENSIMRGGFSNKEFVRFDIDMKNVRYINRENIVSQKKLCMIPYLEHYLGFYYYIKSECPELMDSFKNYRNDYFKNILYAIRNKNLSKMFMILSIVFWVSPKLAKPLYNRII